LQKRSKKLLSVGAKATAGATPPAPQASASREAPGKSFLVLFFKKELLP
jgi:hypothetical protein